MPNWCYNRITVYADENSADKLAELKEIFESPQPFNTAWSPPQGVVEAMRTKYPKLTFQCFYDEPGCEIAGYY